MKKIMKKVYERTYKIIKMTIKNMQDLQQTDLRKYIRLGIAHISMPRRCGKTRAITKLASKFDSIIICQNQANATLILDYCKRKKIGINHKNVCSYRSFETSGRGRQCELVLVDDVKMTPDEKQRFLNVAMPMGCGKDKFCIVFIDSLD